MRRLLVFIALVLLCIASGAHRASAQDHQLPAVGGSASDWSADLSYFIKLIKTAHPDPFRFSSREAFDARAAWLRGAIPHLTRDGRILEFERLIVMLNDGHSHLGIFWADDAAPSITGGFHRYPIRLYRFSDGWYVRRASAAYAGVLGARVLAIGGLPIERVVERLRPYTSHDNEQTYLDRMPDLMVSPEILHALAIVPPNQDARLSVAGGGVHDITLALASSAPALLDMRDPAAPIPLWQQHPDDWYWSNYDDATHLLYIKYGVCFDQAGHEPVAQFFDRTFASVTGKTVDRVIVDLRTNEGGNMYNNQGLLRGLYGNPALNAPGKLYVVIGRSTFSAAQNATNMLEYYTAATFVGEPTGMRPHSFGDHTRVLLPRTHVLAVVSTLWHQGDIADDSRMTSEPDIYTPESSDEYRRGIDPVMAGIEQHRRFSQMASEARKAHDLAGIQDAYRRFYDLPIHKFTRLHYVIRAMAQEFSGAARFEDARTLLAMDLARHPDDWQELLDFGKASESAGKSGEAIRAYRRVLTLRPFDGDAVAGLRRLGAAA